MTLRYAHLSPSVRAKAVAKLVSVPTETINPGTQLKGAGQSIRR